MFDANCSAADVISASHLSGVNNDGRHVAAAALHRNPMKFLFLALNRYGTASFFNGCLGAGRRMGDHEIEFRFKLAVT